MLFVARTGVPESVPSTANVSPSGNVFETTDQTYGSVPPLAENVVLYGTAAQPEGSVTVLIVGTEGGATSNVIVVPTLLNEYQFTSDDEPSHQRAPGVV